jgi:hypothetical protein
MVDIRGVNHDGRLYKSLPSLWSRQIPYTMVRFVALGLKPH